MLCHPDGIRIDRHVTVDRLKKTKKEQVVTTDLVNQELQLDDSRTALMLTEALHTRTAEAKGQHSQGELGS